ncbi:MAG: amidohydrolase [Rhodospirillaceae bacterium]|nr:amidohydrolase [Rhodospirillaceae bacterium]
MIRQVLLSGVCFLVASVSMAAAAIDAPATRAAAGKILDADYPRLDALYKDIHKNPELGFQEVRTAAKLAAEMKAIGFEVTEKVGKTGIVAIFKNGPGPMVMVRTELDALPMEEKTGLPYASTAKQMWNGKETFVDHSCGHDIHMAAWVGTARALVAMKDKWHGTLMFIGQPAEETTGGAKAMLADKLFERFGKPDIGFALHTGPNPAGQVSYKPGVNSSNSDSLEIKFLGRGAHGSRPSQSIDPIMMASRFVVDVQSVVSREKDAAEFGVVTIGAIEGGSAGNIIPDNVVLRGTIRSYRPDVRETLTGGVRRTANAVAMMAGAPQPQVTITPGGDAVVNDIPIAERTGALFKAAFGDKAIKNDEPGSASEDYSAFIQAGVPSLFFGIGGVDPVKLADAKAKGIAFPGNHSPQFAPLPEPAIRTGVEAMTIAVMSVVGQ